MKSFKKEISCIYVSYYTVFVIFVERRLIPVVIEKFQSKISNIHFTKKFEINWTTHQRR